MSKELATHRQRAIYRAREIWQKGFITLDTETTGLALVDQIIQIAVCDQEGKVLYSSYIKPTVPISEGAFEVHGITEEQLADAPTFAQVWETLHDLLKGQHVVIYNAPFDIRKLWSSGMPYGIEIPYGFLNDHCAMQLFAQFYGDIHEYWGGYTWQKLTFAISHLGIKVTGHAHDATYDASATALLIKRLAELADEELPAGWHPPVNVPCAGGCKGYVKECAEADEVWYCQNCGLDAGVFHRCPGCRHIVEVPATGILCDDLCEYCQQKLHREKMLLTGAWHYCPDDSYRLVETPDIEEPCENCQRQREWKRQYEEKERARKERMEAERKERKRLQQKDYRAKKKAKEDEKRLRTELGLPPLEEEQKKKEPESPFIHDGHRFIRRKDQDGRPEVYCLRCEAAWSKPPSRGCAGMKTYRAWTAIPEHLKTETQLRKLNLKLAKGQKPVALMSGYYDQYYVYDINRCEAVQPRTQRRDS